MIAKYRNRAIFNLSVGLLLVIVAAGLALQKISTFAPQFALFLSGFAIYTRGCQALARAKGYSSALSVTAVLGMLPTAIALLVLPDRYKYQKRPTHRTKLIQKPFPNVFQPEILAPVAGPPTCVAFTNPDEAAFPITSNQTEALPLARAA